MTISYEARNLGILTPSTALPSHIKGTMLSEASLYTFSNNETTIVIQQYTTASSTFIIKSIHTAQPVELVTEYNQSACLWQALPEGEKITTQTVQHNNNLIKNQLFFTTVPGNSYTTAIQTPGAYNIIEILVTDTLAEEFKSLFPALFTQTTHSSTIDTDLHQQLDSIRTARMSGSLWNYYIVARIKDILFHTCHKIVEAAQNPLSITEAEWEGINKVAEIITEDITTHIPIPDLARRVGLNEYKLKKLFPLVHGKTIYAYLTHHRMRKAKELLLQNFSVKEVATRIGCRPSDLTITFIQHFGMAPSKFRNTKK
jgi:AraC-like DNA-binding protein